MTFSLHQGGVVMSSQVKHTHSHQDTPLSPLWSFKLMIKIVIIAILKFKLWNWFMPVMYGEGFVQCSIVAGCPVKLCIMFIIIGDSSRPCAVLVTLHGRVGDSSRPCWWRFTTVLVTLHGRVGDAWQPCWWRVTAVLVTRHGRVGDASRPCWWLFTAVLVTRDSRVVLIAENNDADEEDNAESEWPERDTRQPSIVVVDQPDDNDYTTDGNIHDGRSAV